MKNILLKITFFLILCNPAFSANENIDMLNRLGKEINVYSKKIVNVNVGDTVFWKSVNPGHNVEFIKEGIPEGVEKFKSKSFLKNQVRSMVGCLKYLGEGKWDLKKFETVFIKKDRKKVAPPAPACGLYLEKIIY